MFAVGKNAGPFPIHALILADRLHAQVKPGLVFETDGDSPVDGEADFSSNLMQPVFQIRPGEFAQVGFCKPTIQPRRGAGGNPVSQDLAASHHVMTFGEPRVFHQPFIGG